MQRLVCLGVVCRRLMSLPLFAVVRLRLTSFAAVAISIRLRLRLRWERRDGSPCTVLGENPARAAVRVRGGIDRPRKQYHSRSPRDILTSCHSAGGQYRGSGCDGGGGECGWYGGRSEVVASRRLPVLRTGYRRRPPDDVRERYPGAGHDPVPARGVPRHAVTRDEPLL